MIYDHDFKRKRRRDEAALPASIVDSNEISIGEALH
jgi:hypothetical protein